MYPGCSSEKSMLLFLPAIVQSIAQVVNEKHTYYEFLSYSKQYTLLGNMLS